MKSTIRPIIDRSVRPWSHGSLPSLKCVCVLAILQVLASEASAAEQTNVPGTGEVAVEWQVKADSSLRSLLAEWSSSSGWQLIWDSPVDIRIRADAVVEGTFEQAVLEVMKSIFVRHPRLRIALYSGNRVLHVQLAS
ncbi:MAG: toxin co-regulated pilus biosynthesis Q family protein [Rhodobacteraceae bacterium]|nr:toxin co-regulated pilus biosynthesis Q family protein [Paracoccaceae bacterium]